MFRKSRLVNKSIFLSNKLIPQEWSTRPLIQLDNTLTSPTLRSIQIFQKSDKSNPESLIESLDIKTKVKFHLSSIMTSLYRSSTLSRLLKTNLPKINLSREETLFQSSLLMNREEEQRSEDIEQDTNQLISPKKQTLTFPKFKEQSEDPITQLNTNSPISLSNKYRSPTKT